MTKQQGDLLLYLDVLPPTKADYLLRRLHPRMGKFRSDNTGTIMIFLKHLDTMKQSLFGNCKIHVPRKSKLRCLVPTINERMKWPSWTPLKLYGVTDTIFSPA